MTRPVPSMGFYFRGGFMYHTKDVKTIIDHLGSDALNGLSTIEAEKRLQLNGLNELKEAKKESIFKKFFNQFTDPLVLTLIITAIISIVVDPNEWIDSLVIILVVLLNAILGTYQEANAEKSLEALKKLSSPNAKVIRDGELKIISSKEVVVGDIIQIEAGDYIPSDARLIEVHNLKVDESAFSGESLPIEKHSDILNDNNLALADRKNMIYASTIVSYGRAKAIVVASAMDNEIGKIAKLIEDSTKEATPLQLKLAQISKTIGIICFVICFIVFVMEVFSGVSLLLAFKTAVSLAVAAVPEGLAAVVTIVLSIGVFKMVKHNALIRKLPAVETLGACNVICSDKTGTLTQNKMTVVKTYSINEGLKEFKAENHDQDTRLLLSYFTLCSDASIKIENDNKITMIGDPTETALVYASHLMGESKEKLLTEFERIKEIPFDSKRKLMTVFYKCKNRIIQITKGAPDVIFEKAINTNLSEAININKELADKALRVLAVAIRYHNELVEDVDYEKDLMFIGLAAMIDPPREEVKKAIAQAKEGGIRVVMITGDHLITAKAIARELKIIESDNDLALNGSDLDALNEEELLEKLKFTKVFARVSPEHKIRIVNGFKKLEMVVAMTGDGVNDSPALKAADIGCAMGITGTDVAKAASDMVLVDDNFSTIIESVKQGRGIYENIKKVVSFLLSCNIGEVITIFCASLLSLIGFKLNTPLLPIHLLFINLVTDVLPALALAMEEVDPKIIKRKPRTKHESFFANKLGLIIFLEGIMIGMITLIAYLYGNNFNHDIGMTMAFFTLCFSQLVHAFNMKSNQSVLNKSLFNNYFLWLAFFAGILSIVMIYFIPSLKEIFKVASLNLIQLGICILLSLIPLVILELVKLIKRFINV